MFLISFSVLQLFGVGNSFAATFTTWTQRASALSWTSVACNSNCEVVYATVNAGQIYKSLDGGASWSALANSGTYSWKAITTSSSGDIVYAAATGGNIYKSTDAGQSWSNLGAAGSRSWISLKTDSTGSTIAGGVSAGSVWLSSNGGTSWSEVTAIGTSKVWKGLAIIPSGTVLVAAASNGEIWRGVLSSGSWAWTNITTGKTTSPLYGGTTIIVSSLGWTSVAIDTTGEKIAAISNDLYFTSDSGASWKNITWGNYSWISISGSSDLKTMMMLASNGCGSNCRPHIVTTTNYTSFTDSIYGAVGVAYSSGEFAADASRAIAATASSYIYTAGDTYVPALTPSVAAAPAISGNLTYGQVLTSSTGTWNNSPTSYAYQWARSSASGGTYTVISGATSSTYTLASADTGQFIKVTVTATNSSGSASSTSSATSQITKATPTFSIWNNVTKNFGDSSYLVTAPSVTGSLAGSFSYTSSTTSVASISGSTITLNGAGTSIITATFSPTDSANYESATVTHTLTVGKVNQNALTITSTNGNFGTDLTLVTSGGSGTGNVSFTSNPGTTTCTLVGATLTSNDIGTCLVTATKASDANYNSANSIQTTVTFAKGISTSAISIDAGILVYRQAKTLSATSNVSGKVTFKANNIFIPRCKSISVSSANAYTATCIYKPATRGLVVISATFLPSSSSYSPSSVSSTPQFVHTRTTRR